MPQIVEEVYFVGTKERIARLGLTPVVGEIRSAVTAFQLLVSEKKCSQGGSAVRKLIDEQFDRLGGWDKKVSGLEWIKCKVVKGTSVCIGVAVQVSAGSDALFMGLIHLDTAFRE